MKEFEFIELLKDLNRYSDKNTIGIGDDAALIGDFFIAKDLLVQDVHFKIDAGLDNILFKLITANVSDICAMGGISPFYALLGVSSDGSINMEEFHLYLKKALDFYQIDLIGGDTTASRHGLFLSFTILGKRNKFVLTRSGAKIGDIVFISRPVGLSKISLEKELKIGEYDTCEYLHYRNKAEVDLARCLGELPYITSCIDISDGLGRDLGHISEKSSVKIVLKESWIDVSHLEGFGLKNPLEYYLSSGEEYALAFTVDKNFIEEFALQLKKFPSVSMIGEVAKGSGIFLEKVDGSLLDISQYGYEHLT